MLLLYSNINPSKFMELWFRQMKWRRKGNVQVDGISFNILDQLEWKLNLLGWKLLCGGFGGGNELDPTWLSLWAMLMSWSMLQKILRWLTPYRMTVGCSKNLEKDPSNSTKQFWGTLNKHILDRKIIWFKSGIFFFFSPI